MSNIIPFNKYWTYKSLSEPNIVANAHVLRPDEEAAVAEQLRDQIAAITHWLESFQQKLAAH